MSQKVVQPSRDGAAAQGTPEHTMVQRRRRRDNATRGRKLGVIVVLMLVWQLGPGLIGREDQIIPFAETVLALWESVLDGSILSAVAHTVGVLTLSLAIGVVIALILTALSTATLLGRDMLEVLTAMLNPLPAVALVPVAIFLFGFGLPGILFILVNATLWPMAVAWSSGFRGIGRTNVLAVGQNLGLKGLGLFTKIYLPAGVPSLLAGLRQAWAFGWRTIIAVELVFGSQGGGGLGFFIGNARYLNQRAEVYAGLLMIIIIGLTIERLVLEPIEARTVRRWGMSL